MIIGFNNVILGEVSEIRAKWDECSEVEDGGAGPVLTARSLGGTERVNVCIISIPAGTRLSFPLSASVPYHAHTFALQRWWRICTDFYIL